MPTTRLTFGPHTPELDALHRWWTQLQAARGDRATLRRCHTLTEVVFTPAYHAFRAQALALSAYRDTDVIIDDTSLALLIALAARAKQITRTQPLATLMATGKAGGAARVSDLRFRRLLKAREPEALFLTLRRILALLDNDINLASLAASVYRWTDITRKAWAFEYYGVTSTPETAPITPEPETKGVHA